MQIRHWEVLNVYSSYEAVMWCYLTFKVNELWSSVGLLTNEDIATLWHWENRPVRSRSGKNRQIEWSEKMQFFEMQVKIVVTNFWLKMELNTF